MIKKALNIIDTTISLVATKNIVKIKSPPKAKTTKKASSPKAKTIKRHHHQKEKQLKTVKQMKYLILQQENV